jgi:4-aminobutyrate aminotransferase
MIKVTKRMQDIIDRDHDIFLTTTRAPYPFIADHGDGDFVYDIEGNRFIDFSSFISVYNIGVNANKPVREAIKKQVDKLMHTAFYDYRAELPVTFAEKLMTQFPKGFGRVFLSNSGTEANEAAIKIARLLTKRQYIIAFYNSFHGRSLGSLGLTAAKSVQRAHFGPFNGVIHAPYPNPYRCIFDHTKNKCGADCVNYIKEMILEKDVAPDEVAAIIFEPIQGEGGYIVPPMEFAKELRKLADQHDILLIADEVQTGYMRTGKFLALENFGIEADIYTMAKAVGGGLPIGVTVVRKSLGDMPEGAHSNTFGGNLASIAAANASLDYVIKNKRELEKGVGARNKTIMNRLQKMQGKYGIIGDVRGMGLMIAVEFVRNRKTKEHATTERDNVMLNAFNDGLLLLPAGKSVIRIIPPITMSMGSIEKGLDILEAAIKKAERS